MSAALALLLLVGACGETPSGIRQAEYLHSETASQKPVDQYADCIHAKWQADHWYPIGRAPAVGGGVNLMASLGSIHKLASMVEVKPTDTGSVARIYVYSHHEGSAPAVAACA